MTNIAIIMAGGSGTRFWPESRINLPKQFLKIGGQTCLLEKTIDRLRDVLPIENIFVVGSITHKDIINDYLPKDFVPSNIYLEPAAKNTAGAIAAAVTAITKVYGEVNVGVFPSDHHIVDTKLFCRTIQMAYQQADSSNNIITLGVVPTYPATGYGYLKIQNPINDYVYQLDSFVEKPNLEKAYEFLESKSYYWNAGLFFFKSGTILDLFKILLPEIYYLANEISNWHQDTNSGHLSNIYSQMPSISIDYGLMEKITNIEMIILDSGWSDLGSWDSLGSVLNSDSEGNIVVGKNVSLNTKNSVISSKNKLVVTIGIEELVIVETDDILMVCDKKKVQDIKTMVALLKESNYSSYL